MHLVQLLLPVGRPETGAVQRALRATLTSRFGGVTAYTRAPAEGEWQPETGHGAAPARTDDAERAEHDDVIMLEVVVEQIEHAWWRTLRQALERDLAQEVVHIRALPMELL